MDVRTVTAPHPAEPTGPATTGGRDAVRRAARTAGELLITVGLVLVLFVVWQLWWTNLDASETHGQAVTRMADEFGGPTAPNLEAPVWTRPDDPPGGNAVGGSGDATSSAGRRMDDGEVGTPPVAAPPGYGEALGIVYVPRFGADYARPVMQGTGRDVLDTLGLGHYPSTAMPGQVGNFALAGHRQTNGKVLDLVHTLVPGDRIHVRTAQGYYTYVFRDSEIVLPTETRVLAPVPSDPAARPTERVLTLTTCHPRYGSTERFIAYAVLESWRPTAAGPPAEIAATVADETEGR
ncbi:class E sortase [Kocuria rosea]|uniref:class E sortase n=1 Tax=Kocuria rosea TaxID=1275 RepID=UPI0040402E71